MSDRLEFKRDGPQLDRPRPLGEVDDADPPIGTGAQRHFLAKRLLSRLERRLCFGRMDRDDCLAVYFLDAIGFHARLPGRFAFRFSRVDVFILEITNTTQGPQVP
ncbi:hypothetical protein RFM68_23745 [Mesorhizobium sp. MSK_1335]|uniref:Uncharacterized protein n=1 Tax=Mesorhizobium montanum TaxID=3072323 RepID=A0ABU4ZSU6_9HYPH|nr:hypothetical protein [Mesorhizobium sp. MSK_1335]MDX8527517.1 hypothetical protein [Mesorhizobium sp. MSK_1335]